MTTYTAQVEVSADGQIWQAVEARELVDTGTVAPADWFDAKECAEEIGATPGTQVRVLVWPADHVNDGTANGTVYAEEYAVPTDAMFTARYTQDGRISVDGWGQVGTYDADGGEWEAPVTAILNGEKFVRTTEWRLDAAGNSVATVLR